MADQRSDPAQDSPEETNPGATTAIESDDVAAIKKERDDFYDRLLRKTAEFDNYRKRIERERREQADQAVVDLLQELLLVVDDFERALTVDAGDGDPAYRKGVELIHGKLHDILRKYGVRPVEELGADSDPKEHHTAE